MHKQAAAIIAALPPAIAGKHTAALREELTSRIETMLDDADEHATATARDLVTLACYDIRSLDLDAGGFYGPYQSAERTEWRAVYRAACNLLAGEFAAEYAALVTAWASI
jgi:hypothetical protein